MKKAKFTCGLLCIFVALMLAACLSACLDTSQHTHKYGKWVSDNAQTHTRTCSDCGKTETKSHNVSGNQCANCDYTVTSDDHEHTFTNYVSNNDFTCTEDGTKTAKCDYCTETKTIADTGSAKHTPKTAAKENEVSATDETEGGYDLVVRCQVCDAVLSSEHITVGNKYTVTLDVNGGDALEQSEYEINYGDSFTLVTPTRTGYAFLGWYDNDRKVTDTTLGVTENKTFVAEWKANTYTLSLNNTDTNAGAVTGAGDYDYDSNVTISARENLGYNFEGWYDSEDGLISRKSTYTFSMGLTDALYAKWSVWETLTAFRFSSSPTELIITGIEDTTVTEITIPAGVTEIESYVFDECEFLTAVNISDIKKWCEIAFHDESNPLIGAQNLYLNGELVTDLVLPDTVTTIAADAFYGCASLTSVKMGNSVTTIGKGAFFGCINLTSVKIGNGVTSISDSAFGCCLSLTNVEISNSVTSIGDDVFYTCENLTSVEIGSGVTSIGEWAFRDCNNLNDVYISDIAKWCEILFEDDYSNPLYYAHNLYLNGELVIDLVIPETVTSINKQAFYHCDNLESVEIPNSVTGIDKTAFSGCGNLASIQVGNENPNYKSENNCVLTKDGLTLIVGSTGGMIPNGVTSIGDFAFDGRSGLTSLTIPESVTSIGSNVFRDCKNLNAVYISDMVKWCEISFPLNYAHNLYLNGELVTELIIPESVTSIGDYTFYNCSSLTSVVIEGDVTSIGDYTFYNCSSLTSVVIEGDVTSIGSHAFAYCSSLTSIEIPNSVTSVGSYALGYGTSLTRIDYKGTMEQALQISINYTWAERTGDFTIYCEDGTLSKGQL